MLISTRTLFAVLVAGLLVASPLCAQEPDMPFEVEVQPFTDEELIERFKDEGRTVVITTHYMDEAERCDRLAFLSRGHLIGVGTPAEVTSRFGVSTVEDVFIELQRRDEGASV